jgi:hypothetical protein
MREPIPLTALDLPMGIMLRVAGIGCQREQGAEKD